MAAEPLFTASREVLWNVSGAGNVVAMYLAFALSGIVCGWGLLRRIQLYCGGRADPTRLADWNKRFEFIWNDVLNQQSVQRDPTVRGFHNLIFFGFVVLLFTTTMVAIDHDLGIKIYQGQFYLVVTVLSDVFGLLFLLGVCHAFHRRYVVRPDRLHSTRIDAILLGILAALAVQGFFLEGLRIRVTSDPWRAYSMVGWAVSGLFWPLSVEASKILHYLLWWVHTLTVFAAFALVPYTKFLHVIASSANLFFRELRKPKGALKYPGDIEQLMEASLADESGEFRIGVSTIEDLTWKQRLDLDACTSCGRCQDACPAYMSGKILSPKWLILDSRDHMLRLRARGKLGEAEINPLDALDARLLEGFVLDHDYSTHGSDVGFPSRAANPLVQRSALDVGGDVGERLGGQVMEEDVFWSCTTCRACMEACPVGIEHVDLIVDVRRSLALMEGSIPAEAQSSLRAIETRGNPFGPSESRSDWTEGLNVPILKEGDAVDVLYWVGCVSAYDKRKQRIARSLAKILNASGLSWGILGNREHCTGDPARRLGEENLFQTSAKKNIETLASIRFETVVANCPHCFNTLKNEYSQIGSFAPGRDVRVLHHSEFINELIARGKISVQKSVQQKMTFHDPCYLGRYNDVYSEPRELLVQIGTSPLSEMPASREKGLCCGAGGGHFWMDMKVGERVNVIRTNQAAETGAEIVATGCPFCMQMLEDGSKLTNREDSLQVRDLAELVAESLQGSAD